MQYLVREITVLKEGPLFEVGVYVSKGGCVPINLRFYSYGPGFVNSMLPYLS